MTTLNSHLDRFLIERTYLKNVSPKTRVWYETAWKTFLRTQVPDFGTTSIDSPQAITRQHLHEFVIALRDRGVRPVTVNTWLCPLNAFCRWLHDEGTLAEPVRLRRLRSCSRRLNSCQALSPRQRCGTRLTPAFGSSLSRTAKCSRPSFG